MLGRDVRVVVDERVVTDEDLRARRLEVNTHTGPELHALTERPAAPCGRSTQEPAIVGSMRTDASTEVAGVSHPARELPCAAHATHENFWPPHDEGSYLRPLGPQSGYAQRHTHAA